MEGIVDINCPEKVKNFLWRACLNALPVCVNLNKIRIIEARCCPFCGHLETVEHALLGCEWSQHVWFGAMRFRMDARLIPRFDDWPCGIMCDRIISVSIEIALNTDRYSYIIALSSHTRHISNSPNQAEGGEHT